MTVRLVGDGPAVDAVRATLADVGADVEAGSADDLADAELGVVAAGAGAEAFERARDRGERWIAIELGGVGGAAVDGVEAAVSGFGPETACYECLRQRVAASDERDAERSGGGAEADDAEGSGGEAEAEAEAGDVERSGGGAEADGVDATDVDDATARLAGATAGREAARLLAGDDRISGQIVELPHARRTLLPVPGCDCETRRDETLAASRSLPIPREHVDRPLEETVARMDTAIDERVGIVGQIGEAHSFPAPYYLATLASTTGFSDGDAPHQAAGVDHDWNAALVKAIGESLERYAGAVYRTDAFEHAAPAELEPDEAVAPADFAGAPEGAPDADAGEALPWVEAAVLTAGGTATDATTDDATSATAGEDGATSTGEDGAAATGEDGATSTGEDGAAATGEDGAATTGEDDDAAPPEDDRVLVPASAVHFPPPEARSLPGITTGLGLGSSPVGALLSGLTEVIERDAAMLAWYSTFEPLGLAVEDPAFERLARRARGEGLTVTPLLLTQDVDVPVVAVALHREEEWPQFAVAADAALDPATAATGALAEALQNWMELRSTGPDDASELSAAIGDYAAFPEPARAFVDVDRTVSAGDLLTESPPTGEAALDALLAALSDADCPAYAARLTTPDLTELGFEAVRVVVPDAQPLFTRSPRFGERARRVPEELGFEPRLDREPHPYP